MSLIRYEWMGRYVVSYRTPSIFPKIEGRVFGGQGFAYYQIAARPYDEISVGPFADEGVAFGALVRELETRATVARGPNTYHATQAMSRPPH